MENILSKRILHGGGDADENPTLNYILQGAAIFILLIITLIFGFLPLFVKAMKANLKITGIANAFSCGIFIGISLIHILPETASDFKNFFHKNGHTTLEKLPICYFIAFFSFSLILFIEKVAFDSHALIEHEHGDGDDHIHKHEDNHIHNFSETLPLPQKKEKSTDDSSSEDEADILKNIISTRRKVGSFIKESSKSFHQTKEKKAINESLVGVENSFVSYQHDFKRKSMRSVAEKALNNQIIEVVKPQLISENNIIEHPGHDHVNEHVNRISFKSTHGHSMLKVSSPLTPYLLLVALSFHGFFEGIALGLSKSSKSTISFFIAIIGHKWAESLTLGISFSKTQTEKSMFIKMIIIFSFFTPVGVGIGMILNSTSEWVQCVFMSLTVGTFFYIAASEIIVEEFSISRYKWVKLFFMMLGLLLISGMTIWEISGEEDHDEDDDDDHDH